MQDEHGKPGVVVVESKGQQTNGVHAMAKQILLNLDEMQNELLIDIANALSRDIDRLAIESQSLIQKDYDHLINELEFQFDTFCNTLELRGVVVSDVVICPHNV